MLLGQSLRRKPFWPVKRRPAWLVDRATRRIGDRLLDRRLDTFAQIGLKSAIRQMVAPAVRVDGTPFDGRLGDTAVAAA